jgi:hypothetical protein
MKNSLPKNNQIQSYQNGMKRSLLSKSADLSKQEGDFFKLLWPFQKS